MPKKFNQFGFAPIVVVLILLLGLGVGVYLVQKTQIFRPKADIGPSIPQTMLGLNTDDGKTEYESGKDITVFLVARADIADVSEIKTKLSYDTAALEIKSISGDESTDSFAKDPKDVPSCNSVPDSVVLEFRQGQKKCKDGSSLLAKYKCGGDSEFTTMYSTNKCETLEEFKADAINNCAKSEACKSETEKVKGPGGFVKEMTDKSFDNFLGSANIDALMQKDGFKTNVSNPNASQVAKVVFVSKPNSRTQNTIITIDPSATQFISKSTGQPLTGVNLNNLTLNLRYTNDLYYCIPTGYEFTSVGCKGGDVKLTDAKVTCGNGVIYDVPDNSCRTKEGWLGKYSNDGIGYIDSAICKLPDPATGFARNRCAATNSSANNANCTLAGQAVLDTSAQAIKDCSAGNSRKATYQCAGNNGASGVLGDIKDQCRNANSWNNQANSKCLESPACTGISPFEVTKVKVDVNKPGNSKCPKTYTFNGEITVRGAGTVQYKWLKSDNTVGQVKSIVFTESGTKKVTDTWQLSSALFDGWENLEVISPNPIKGTAATFTHKCNQPSN